MDEESSNYAFEGSKSCAMAGKFPAQVWGWVFCLALKSMIVVLLSDRTLQLAAGELIHTCLGHRHSLSIRASGVSLPCKSPSAWPCHSSSFKAKLDTLSALAQLKQFLPGATEIQPGNDQTTTFARYRFEPVYPCTVSGSGACGAGVSRVVAINKQVLLTQSVHTR